MRVLLYFAVLLSMLLVVPTHMYAQVEGPITVQYRTAPNYRGGTDTLHMKVWRPTVKHNRPLPLIIWIHGGAFYTGAYTDMVAECERWVERGFIAATIQYRLGFYGPPLLDPPYAYDRAEVIRACWRGMQDVRFGLRQLVKGAIVSDIDTSCIVLGGESAGSILVMQLACTDVADSVPVEVDSLADVVRGFDRFKRPPLGDIDGYPFGSKRPVEPLPHICGILNRFGGVMFPYMLDVDQFPALFSYHQRGDIVVACGVNRGLWGMPFGVGDNYPLLTGSCALDVLLTQAGRKPELRETFFVEGIGHGLHDPQAVYTREQAFVNVVACPPPVTSVPELTNHEPSSWKAYTLLGQFIAGGSSQHEADEWLHTSATGPVIMVRVHHNHEPDVQLLMP